MTEDAIAALERECAQALFATDGNRGVEQFLTLNFTASTSVKGAHFRIEERAADEDGPSIEGVFSDVWISADGGWRLAERHESRPLPE